MKIGQMKAKTPLPLAALALALGLGAFGVQAAAFDAAHTIVCYGDSLTFGECSESVTVDGRANFFGGRLAGVRKEGCYPYWLSGMVPNYNVVSQARGGMYTDMITSWRGGRTLKTKDTFTLTANRALLNTNLLFDGTDLGRLGNSPRSSDDPPTRDKKKEYGGLIPPVLPLSESYADSGAGTYGGTIVGTLAGYRVRITGTRSTNICIQAIGSLPNGSVEIPAGTVFKPDAAELDPYKDAIHVFLAGANDGRTLADTYLPEISATVEKIPSGRYLVVSPSINTTSDSEYAQRYTLTTATDLEKRFADLFGDRYLNLRAELSKRGLDIAVANDWMTAEQKTAAGNWGNANGLLASDNIHFNTRGYKVVAYLVNEKLRQLGYIADFHDYVDFGGSTTSGDGTYGSYFKTDYKPHMSNTRIEMGFWLKDSTWNTKNSQGFLYASGFSNDRDNTVKGNCLQVAYLYPKSGRTRQVSYDNHTLSKSYYGFGDMTKFHTLVVEGRKMTFDGVVATLDGTALDEYASGPLVVGTMMWLNSQNKPTYNSLARMRLSYLKIYENGELLRDYCPAATNGVAGLYDRERKVFKELTTQNSPDPAPSVGDGGKPEDDTPYALSWKGGAASQNWTTTDKWESKTYSADNGAYPLTGGYATFTNVAENAIVLDKDVTLKGAVFGQDYKSTKTVITGGHALTLAYADDQVLDSNQRLFCGGNELTVSGANTAVNVLPTVSIGQSWNTTIVAENGGKFENLKWGFSNNGGYHFVATNTDSEVTLKTVAQHGYANDYTFKAQDGGKVSVINGGLDLNFSCSTQSYVADGGTLELTGVAITGGTPALTAGGSGTMTLKSITATASGTTVTLKPNMDWNATDAHITTTGELTLGGSVKYTVDVTGLSGLGTDDKKMAVATAGGTLGYTAGTVTLTGTGKDDFTAAFTKEDKTLYVTVTRTRFTHHATGSGVNVRVPTSWAKDKGVTTDAELENTGANGMKKWESYALGLDPATATHRICAKPRQTAQGAYLKATFPDGTTKPTDSGVTVKYQLYGKTTGGTYGTIGDASTSDEFSLNGLLPASGVKYFQIRTVYENNP